MAGEITIHGTPEGQKVAGVRDANIEACYGTVGAKDILLMIEQKIVEGKPYCYYHYLLNEDIAQYSGRLGGYIGISLRTDLFSSQIFGIYGLLDQAFRTLVQPQLLARQGSGFRFKGPDISSELQQAVEKAVTFGVDTYFALQYQSQIRVTPQALIKDCNLLECEKPQVIDWLTKGNSLRVSAWAPRDDEQRRIKQYQAEVAQAKEQAKEQTALVAQERNRNAQLEKDLQISNKIIKEVNHDLEQAKLMKGVAPLLERFNKEIAPILAKLDLGLKTKTPASGSSILPVTRTKDNLETLSQTSRSPLSSSALTKYKSLLPLVNTILLLLLCVTVFLSRGSLSSDEGSSSASTKKTVFFTSDGEESEKTQGGDSVTGSSPKDSVGRGLQTKNGQPNGFFPAANSNTQPNELYS